MGFPYGIADFEKIIARGTEIRKPEIETLMRSYHWALKGFGGKNIL